MALKEVAVVWLQGAGCTGCSISALNAVSPKIKNLILDEIVPGKRVNLRFHTTIMAGAGDAVIQILEDTQKHKKGEYILVVEGAIPTAKNGIYGSVGRKGKRHITILDTVIELGKGSSVTIALGTCAAFGGIPKASPNPTGCKGVKELFTEKSIHTPVLNISGCPIHPEWFFGTIAALLLGRQLELDDLSRPKLFYGKLIHEQCPRRSDFDKGKFAKCPGDEGCFYQLGCKGHYTYADCPLRLWNNGVSWCVKAGSPCIGCVEPGFPDLTSPVYEKINLKELTGCTQMI